jgi:hypothetical protein
LSCHSISLFHDLEEPRLLFATEGHPAEVVAQFAENIETHGGCAENVRDVCIDMSSPRPSKMCKGAGMIRGFHWRPRD